MKLDEKRVERFWDRVETIPFHECWEWTGYCAKRKGGEYGSLGPDRAHRISWTIHFGEIPDGLLVCHHCDNPSCVNPKHLFLGTNEDNMLDMMKKNRGPWFMKGLAHPGHFSSPREFLGWLDDSDNW